MTTFTYDENLYSDLYKDTYGFRPRYTGFYEATPEQKQRIWDDLLSAHERAMDEYHARQERTSEELQLDINRLLKVGASDEATAIRWLVEAECDTDVETFGADYVTGEFCYLRDLSYSAWHQRIKEALIR